MNVVPDIAIDRPTSPDLPQIIDGPAGIDALPASDAAPAVDGPTAPSDAHTTTLWNPDGRIVTVVVLDYCQMSSAPSTACVSSYAGALANARSAIDAGRLHVRAGRCAEGNYTYIPFSDGLDGQACYYSPSQQLIGDMYFTDVMSECSLGSGTGARAFANGEIPPCTDVTWEIDK